MAEKPKIMFLHPAGNYLGPEKEKKAAVIPLGISYLAAVLRENDFEVKILDVLIEGYNEERIVRSDQIRYGLSPEAIAKEIFNYSPNIVGVTCPQATKHHEAHEIFAIAKSLDPAILTVMGGAHASSLPELNLRDDALDLVMIGEAEISFLEVVRKFNDGERDFSGVDGLAYKKDGKVLINPKMRFVDNLDDLPYPAYDLLKLEKYYNIGVSAGFDNQLPYVIMITSRGCPNVCPYCPVGITFGRRLYRTRSVENIIGEISLLVNNYGIKEIQFEDSNMTKDRKRMIRFCDELIRNKFDIIWAMPHGTEVATLDDELLEKMRSAGCYALSLAVESGNQDYLKDIRKTVNLDKVQKVIKKARTLGYKVKCYFMIGNQGETRSDIIHTVEYAKGLDLDSVCMFIATPLPGTEFYNYARERKLLPDNIDLSNLRYAKGCISTEEFDPDMLEKLRRDTWLDIIRRRSK